MHYIQEHFWHLLLNIWAVLCGIFHTKPTLCQKKNDLTILTNQTWDLDLCAITYHGNVYPWLETVFSWLVEATPVNACMELIKLQPLTTVSHQSLTLGIDDTIWPTRASFREVSGLNTRTSFGYLLKVHHGLLRASTLPFTGCCKRITVCYVCTLRCSPLHYIRYPATCDVKNLQS